MVKKVFEKNGKFIVEKHNKRKFKPVADPIKLFFFDDEEFLRFCC